MGSKRTIVTISDEDKLWLMDYSRAYGISMAEAIRKGIARLREEEGMSMYQRMEENHGYLEKRRWLAISKKIAI